MEEINTLNSTGQVEEVEEKEAKYTCFECGTELVTVKGAKGGPKYRCPECNRFRPIEKKEESSPEATFLETGEALIRFVVHIPSSIVTLFYYAKANNLIQHEDIISFMTEYTEYGFMRAHGLALTLAPIKLAGDGSSQTDIEELKDTLASLKKEMGKLARRR